jgi:glycerophosphoryl diester phosphodiesterase
VIQEYNDPTVFYGTGVKAFKKLGSTFKRFHKTKLNTHLTIYDKGLECNVFCKISKFLKDVVEHKFVNIAHRGASGDFPENTVLAFEEAINHGCDMIELDVQRIGSKLRVFHDRDFQRMFGLDTNVKDISEEDVVGLTYPNLEKIPTLEEALDCIDGRVDVNIEIKGAHIATNIAVVVKDYLSKPSWEDADIILSSFSQGEIHMLRHQYADISLSYLLYEEYCNLDELKKMKPQYLEKKIHSINLPIEEISEEIVEYCNDNNIRIYVYTANELKEIRYLRELGVNGVFTDYPSRIQ